jgi:hypothetical protein
MAKGKRAVALFEVINTAKSKGAPDPVAPGPLPRPWWKFWQKPSFRRDAESRPLSDAPVVAVHRSIDASAAVESAPPVPSVSAMPVRASEPVAEIVVPPVVASKPELVFTSASEPIVPPAPAVWYAQHVEPGHEEETLDEAPAIAPPPVDVKLDRDRKWITLRLNYTSAAVVGFAVLVLIGLAFIVGQHSGQGIAADDPFRAAPLRADVLDVTGASSTTTASTETPPARRETTPPPQPQVEQPRPQANAEQPRPQPQLANARVVGLNYVVVQSFADSTLAEQAAQMLRQAGIDVTIERGLTGYAGSSWYCVVGTRGFEASQGESFADYNRYVSAIREVGRQFAAKTRGKEFEPQRYRWRDVR